MKACNYQQGPCGRGLHYVRLWSGNVLSLLFPRKVDDMTPKRPNLKASVVGECSDDMSRLELSLVLA